jgi:epoxyqueuosine reductase
MMATIPSKAEAIKTRALSLGYTGCGVIPVDFYREFHDELERRSQLFPHSASFYDLIKPMAQVLDKFPWAKSIVVGLRRYDRDYALPEGVDRLVGRYYLVDGRLPFSKEFANQSALAEYLKTLDLQAAPSTQMMPARWSAVRAGLGKFRNNNFVYTEKGSWNVIDTWVVNEVLDYEPPADNPRFACPEGCNKCVEACPTGALSAPFTMDATRCISYLTYESRYRPTELPPEELRASMGEWVYGCDLCQQACPFNAKTWREGTELFPEPWPLTDIMSLEKLADMDQKTYEQKVQQRFWYIGKKDIWQWKSNAIRAMANTGKAEYEPYIERAMDDPHANVRAMAAWALAHIRRAGLPGRNG